MRTQIGEVEALYRYPVKSMRGELVESSALGWHGLDGDRRLAFHRLDDRRGFPWLTATSLRELILYAPQRREPAAAGDLPTHVRTPAGRDLPLFSEELAAEVSALHGSPVQMMHLNRGIFDEASVSLITSATVAGVAELSGGRADVRRFRPNVLIASSGSKPFEEDEWLHGVLTFGEGSDCATVGVTNRDERCAMVNFDPDSARPDSAVLKTIVRERQNKVGLYGATIRCGRIAAGQPVYFERVLDEDRH